MKNLVKIAFYLLLCFPAIILYKTAHAETLNIYSWTGYIPTSVLHQFTKETGITVHLSEYDSNETMYAKLKASPHAGYDIIIPSSYFIERMIRQNMLHQIDKTKIPNLKNINSVFLNREYDPQNNYSIPYLWGATGIAVNTDYIDPKEVQSWQDLWNPKYKDQLMMLSDLREIFGMALITLGYSVNDKNPDHIKEAYLKLKTLLPNIKIFNSDAEQTIYIDEDAIIGMGFNGDIHLTQQENPKVKFIYPKDGFMIWIDSLAIAKNAPHVDNALKFINFALRPDIAKAISLDIGYATANLEATKLMPKEIQNDITINPSTETLKRSYIQRDLGEAMPIYEKYWELLKIGA